VTKPRVALALVAALGLSQAASAQSFLVTGPFNGTFPANVIAHPAYLNIYMSNGWNTEPALQASETTSAIDAWTLALVHSDFFTNITQYGVSLPVFLGSFQNPGGCQLPSGTVSMSAWDIAGWVNCQLTSPALNTLLTNAQNAGFNVVVNVLLPPGVTPVARFGQTCPRITGFHDANQDTSSFLAAWTAIPTNTVCNFGFTNLTQTLSHEMAESVTDPFGYLGFVHRDGIADLDFNDTLSKGEIGDVCAPGGDHPAPTTNIVSFLQGVALNSYWSNSLQACAPVWPITTPTVTNTTVSVSPSGVTLEISGSQFGNIAPALSPSSVVGPAVTLPLTGATIPYFRLSDLQLGGVTFNAGNSIAGDSIGLDYQSWSPGAIQVRLPAANAGGCDALSYQIWNAKDGSSAAGGITVPGPARIVLSGFPMTVRAGSSVPGTVSLFDATGAPYTLNTPVTITVNGASWVTTVSRGSAQLFPVVFGTTRISASTSGCGTASDASVIITTTPYFNRLFPGYGINSGGRRVQILGSGLKGTTAVAFGGVPAAQLKVVSDGEIDVVAPAHAAGEVAVTVQVGKVAATPVGRIPPTFVFHEPDVPVLTPLPAVCGHSLVSVGAWDRDEKPFANAALAVTGDKARLLAPATPMLDDQGTAQLELKTTSASSSIAAVLGSAKATAILAPPLPCADVRMLAARIGEQINPKTHQCKSCVQYSDLKGDTRHQYCYDVAAWGLMKGVGTRFLLAGPVSRAQLVDTIAKLAGPRATLIGARLWGLSQTGALADQDKAVSRAEALQYLRAALQLRARDTQTMSAAASASFTRDDLASFLYGYVKSLKSP
jgi:hypothetical protein